MPPWPRACRPGRARSSLRCERRWRRARSSARRASARSTGSLPPTTPSGPRWRIWTRLWRRPARRRPCGRPSTPPSDRARGTSSRAFAQAVTLDMLVELANGKLAELKPRYGWRARARRWPCTSSMPTWPTRCAPPAACRAASVPRVAGAGPGARRPRRASCAGRHAVHRRGLRLARRRQPGGRHRRAGGTAGAGPQRRRHQPRRRLQDRIPVQVRVARLGAGRSTLSIVAPEGWAVAGG